MQPSTPKVASKQLQILCAARDLLAENDYLSITMVEIAKEAGVGRATLYRYYPTKEALYGEVVSGWQAQLVEQLQQHPLKGKKLSKRIRRVLQAIVESVAATPGLVTAQQICALADNERMLATQRHTEAMMNTGLKLAVGPLQSTHQDLASRVLCHLFLGQCNQLSASEEAIARLSEELSAAAELILADIWKESLKA